MIDDYDMTDEEILAYPEYNPRIDIALEEARLSMPPGYVMQSAAPGSADSPAAIYRAEFVEYLSDGEKYMQCYKPLDNIPVLTAYLVRDADAKHIYEVFDKEAFFALEPLRAPAYSHEDADGTVTVISYAEGGLSYDGCDILPEHS